ncbi:TPA: polysaccharide biosynthesis C-terminal domain-containing protein, partial [Enterococcus faecium]
NKLDQIYVKSVFIGAIVNFLSNSLLIKNYYSIGAAIGTLLAEIAVCVYISYKIRNDLDISYMVWISVPFIISGIIMFSVLLNVKLPFESLSSIMLGKILIGVPIYMGSLLLQIIIIKLTKKIV